MSHLNDEEALVEEAFSYFTYISSNTTMDKVHCLPNHQNVAKVSNVKELNMQNGPCQYYIFILVEYN